MLERLIVNCLLVVACMIAHELGHIVTALFFRIPVKEVGISWKGPYIRRGRGIGWPEVATCLAGPAVNLVLAILLWKVSSWFALCNLVFAVVNVLPIRNSDGTHAMDAMKEVSQ